jgi:hypothetical protein
VPLNTFNLSREQASVLRERHPVTLDQAWVPPSAHSVGWVETNRRYLAAERQRGEGEMRDLLAELGLSGPRDVEEAVHLLAQAVDVYATGDAPDALATHTAPGTLRISITACPGYRLMEEQRWHGITACGSWYRRRGWLDALGVDATDSVVAEQKWGDPACVAEVTIRRLRQPVA